MHSDLGIPARRVMWGCVTLAMALALGLTLLAGCGKSRILPPIPRSGTPTGGGDAGGTISGTVFVESGGPAVGAVVTLERLEGGLAATVRHAIAEVASGACSPHSAVTAARARSLASSASAADVRATVTDRLGHYEFGAVEDGDYLVRGSARNYLAADRSVHVEAALAETTFVDIRLRPTGTFVGSATLENATDHRSTIVYVIGSSSVAVTDTAGHYEMRGVPIGSHELTATHVGYRDRSASATLSFAGDSVAVPPMVLALDSNIAPTATASASGSCENVLVQLTGSGIDPDGTIARYEWDFQDDGTIDYSSTSSGNTTHLYGAGSFQARFTVTDNRGRSESRW